MRLLWFLTALIASQAVASEPVLLAFVREGCAPCSNLKEALKASPEIYRGYELKVIDTKENPGLARQYRVRSVPVLVVEEDGREIRRRSGFSSSDELRDWLNNKSRRRSRR